MIMSLACRRHASYHSCADDDAACNSQHCVLLSPPLNCGHHCAAAAAVRLQGQRAHVVSVMLRNGTMRSDLYQEVEVSSVDAFQVGLSVRTQ